MALHVDFLALHGLSALDVLGKSNAKKFVIAFWRCMCFLALHVHCPDALAMVLLWCCYGFAMVLLWFGNGFAMILSWCWYDFALVLLWLGYGLAIVLL